MTGRPGRGSSGVVPWFVQPSKSGAVMSMRSPSANHSRERDRREGGHSPSLTGLAPRR